MPNLPENPGFTSRTLTERVDGYYAEKNEWKKINGGCPITPDVDGTLKTLAESVRPRQADLAAMIRRSVESRDAQGRSLEQIWSEKIAEGANYVGVVEGVFHFFKGEEIMAESNKPLRISALPVILEYREVERTKVHNWTQTAIAELKASLRGQGPSDQARVEGGSVSV